MGLHPKGIIISVMKPFAFGSRGLALNLLVKFAENEMDFTRIGVGILMKFSSKLMANYITYGEPSTTKAKFLNAM